MALPDEEKLPQLNDAILGAEEVVSLFRDYRECTELSGILIKPGPGHVPTDAPPTLEQAEEFIQHRAVRGVQVRYRFAGSMWCDTLMPFANGVRLIRMRQE